MANLLNYGLRRNYENGRTPATLGVSQGARARSVNLSFQDDLFVLWGLAYDRSRELKMGLRHFVRHSRDPLVESDVLIVCCFEHLQEHYILGSVVLDLVARHRRHKSHIVGIEILGASLRSRRDDSHPARALDPVLPFAHVWMPMHLAYGAWLECDHSGGDTLRDRKLTGINDADFATGVDLVAGIAPILKVYLFFV